MGGDTTWGKEAPISHALLVIPEWCGKRGGGNRRATSKI